MGYRARKHPGRQTTAGRQEALRALALAAALGGLLLSGCESLPKRVDDPQRAWAERQLRLQGLRDWTAFGRLAVKSDNDGWNARLWWRQRADQYQIRLTGPLGQGLVELRGGPDGVVLRTADNKVYRARDPAALLREHVGWQVPLGGMRYWVLGRAEPAVPLDRLELDGAGRPSRMRQSGWTIEYQGYRLVEGLALPTRMALNNPRVKARLLVSRWELASSEL